MTADPIEEQYVQLRSQLTSLFLDGGRLAVVKAPPGSGKTHTLIEVLSALVADGGLRVAVAAQTNSQADDICRRFAVTHPEIHTTRFAAHPVTSDIPTNVLWVTDKSGLPLTPGVTVSTTAKWSLTSVEAPYDLLAVDEAWQMAWADLMQCALLSERFLLIGDPGQIPPVVTIDVRRWETSPRAPHLAAPDVVLDEPSLESVRFVGSLPACRRLPFESVDFVRPFYDFGFEAMVAGGSRGVDLAAKHRWAPALGSGMPLALTVPTPEYGPPVEVDHEMASAAGKVVDELLGDGVRVRSSDKHGPIAATDIGVTSSHRVMNSAITTALGKRAQEVRVDTPERWQGLERPVMIAIHPLSGVTDPSAFDVETGRLCVMASRHQSALIVLARDHVGDTLRNFVPTAGQAPGRPDAVGRGHDAHLKFWTRLEQNGCIADLT